MADETIRPSAKGVIGWILLSSLLLIAALTVIFLQFQQKGAVHPAWWVLLGPPLLIDLYAVALMLRLRQKQFVLGEDVLRFEEGLVAKSQRSMMLAKVQDVRVSQSLPQRLFGVGDIAVTAAGDSQAMTLDNVDRPQELADRLMAKVRQQRRAG